MSEAPAASAGSAGAAPSVEPTDVLLVLTTVASPAEGDAVARRLVGSGLAACVNALPGVRSLFRWQGKLDEAEEVLLVVKTLAARYEDVRAAILEVHSYDIPEVVALRAHDVEARFAAWIADACAGRRSEENVESKA